MRERFCSIRALLRACHVGVYVALVIVCLSKPAVATCYGMLLLVFLADIVLDSFERR